MTKLSRGELVVHVGLEEDTKSNFVGFNKDCLVLENEEHDLQEGFCVVSYLLDGVLVE